MTYLGFLLVFIALPVACMGAALAIRENGVTGYGVGWLLLITVAALAYTTPWDNYLVWRGVWWYGEDRVLGTIGYVPLEEYAFMALQPFLSGLWFLWWRNRRPGAAVRRPGRIRAIGALLWLAVSAGGALMLLTDQLTYLGLILVWAGPVLAIQWILGGEKVLSVGSVFWLGLVPPTLYLWVIDRIAIGSGVWTISSRFTTGFHVVGLPVEEAAFFLATNLLVIQALVLLLPAVSRAPIADSPPGAAGPPSSVDLRLDAVRGD